MNQSIKQNINKIEKIKKNCDEETSKQETKTGI